MNRLRRALLPALGLLLACHLPAWADTLMLGAGAGYRRPVTELLARFEQVSGHHVDPLYAHLSGVVAQARQTGQIAVILGDQAFLDKAGVACAETLPLGHGRLVLAWPKGAGLNDVKQLTEPRFARIALPDAKAAIYGIAATEFLQRSGLQAPLAGRLQQTATVPQVSAYLISGEVDAGFLNLTDVLGIRDKIGGYLEIDPALYSPIRIVVCVLDGHTADPTVRALGAFLQTADAKAILARHGL